MNAIRRSHHVRLLLSCQIRHRFHRSDLHFTRNRARADVQRTTENEWETQHIVHLIGVIRASRRDNRVWTNLFDQFRQNFGRWIGQSKNQWVFCHFFDHLLFEHATRRQTEENVRAFDGFRQSALFCFLCKFGFVFIHQHRTAFEHHPFDVRDPNVFDRQTQIHQQIQTRQRRRTCTRGDQFDFFDVLTNHRQTIGDACTHDNRRTVLIVMKHRDAHAFAQFALDIEAIGCFDVLKVNATKSRLKRRNDFNQFLRIGLVQFDVKHINASKFFEQYRFTLHDGLAGERANITQTQHCRAIGDHPNEIATRGITHRIGWIGHDFLTRRRHTRRIRQGQIVLIRHVLGGLDRDFARLWKLMIIQCCLTELVIHRLCHAGILLCVGLFFCILRRLRRRQKPFKLNGCLDF